MDEIKKFFWICSGSHVSTLENCESEAGKYAGIGATIFFTGLFAAVAAGYALYTVFDSVIWAMLFGVIWGLMIFNLDRYIVSGMRKEGSGFKQFFVALPRLILALLISIVIAKPLEMKIFEKEIAEELAVMHQETLAEQEDLIRQRYAGEQEAVSSQIARLEKQIQDKEAVRDELVRVAREEADGTGGSMRRNAGPIYQIKKTDADKAEAELRDIRNINEELITQQRTRLGQIESAIATDMARLSSDITDGPAARMEALSRLTRESDAIYWANVFIILLFLAVETAPIFVKLISHRGPYDHEIKVLEYPYHTRRLEEVARTTVATRERVEDLPEFDRSHVNERLNTLLKSGS